MKLSLCLPKKQWGPVDLARQMGSDIVIAADVVGGFNSALPSWLGQAATDTQRSLAIALRRLYDSKMEQAPHDVLINLNGRLSVSALTGYTRAADLTPCSPGMEESIMSKKLDTVPNYLTTARLVMTPLLWMVALLRLPVYLGTGLLITGLTDILDRYAARKLNQSTDLVLQRDFDERDTDFHR